MSKPTANEDAKKRARELVAQVKKRVASQEGSPEPEAAVEEPESSETPTREGEAEAMAAKSAQAKGVRKQHALDKSHVARAQGHAAARTQRTQARGDK